MSSLLTDIKSPQLNADYAKNLSGVFDNIHHNFEQIVSIPYLAGAAGAPFEAQEVKIWKDNSNPDKTQWTLNEWGVRLVNAIFFDNDEKSQFSEDEVYSKIGVSIALLEQHIENSTNSIKYQKVSGSQYTYAYENLFVNDTLYLYVTRDDSNEISNQYLGQYYHFTDARLANKEGIHNVQEQSWAFEDASCFLYYIPDKDNPLKGTFHKIYSLPVVYYDTTNSDWCWMFDNNKTGISCKGIRGEQGINGVKFHMVRVDHTKDLINDEQQPQNIGTALYYNDVVDYVAFTSDADSTVTKSWKPVDSDFIDSVHDGDAAYAILAQKESNGNYKCIDVTMCTLYKSVQGIKASYARIDMFRQWDHSFINELKQIGVEKADLHYWNRGIFIPAISFESNATESYMFWADSMSNILHIGLVNAPNVKTPVVVSDATIQLENNTDIEGNLNVVTNTSTNTLSVTEGASIGGDVKIDSNAQIGGQLHVADSVLVDKDIQIDENVYVKGPIRNTAGNQYIDLSDTKVALRGEQEIQIQASDVWFSSGTIYFDPYQNLKIETLPNNTKIGDILVKNSFKFSPFAMFEGGENIYIVPQNGPKSIDVAYDALIGGTGNVTQKNIDTIDASKRTSVGTVTYSSTTPSVSGSTAKKLSASTTVVDGDDWGINIKSYTQGKVTVNATNILATGDATKTTLNIKNIKNLAATLVSDVRAKYAKLGTLKELKIELAPASFRASNSWIKFKTNFKPQRSGYPLCKWSNGDAAYNSSNTTTFLQMKVSGNGSIIGTYPGNQTTTPFTLMDSSTNACRVASNKHAKNTLNNASKGFGVQMSSGDKETVTAVWKVPISTSTSIYIPKTTLYEYKDEVKTSIDSVSDTLVLTGTLKPVSTTLTCNIVSQETSSNYYGERNAIGSQETTKTDIQLSPSTVTLILNVTGSYAPTDSTTSKVKIFNDQVIVEGNVKEDTSSTSTFKSICRLTAAGLEIKNAKGKQQYLLGVAEGKDNNIYTQMYNEMIEQAKGDLKTYNEGTVIPAINKAGEEAQKSINGDANQRILDLAETARLLAGTSSFGENDSLWSLKNGYITEFTGKKKNWLDELDPNQNGFMNILDPKKNGFLESITSAKNGATKAIDSAKVGATAAIFAALGDSNLDVTTPDPNTAFGKIAIALSQSKSIIGSYSKDVLDAMNNVGTGLPADDMNKFYKDFDVIAAKKYTKA